jgi:hypothetical protein
MKKFILDFSKFIVVPLGVFLLAMLGIYLHDNLALANYKVGPGKTSIFVGDSHVQLAINDKLLSEGINLSQQSESYKYSFFKMQTILKNNPSIKKMYLGFGYHSLSSYYDDYISGKYSKFISSRYFFILPTDEKMLILKQNCKQLPELVKTIISNNFETLLAKDRNALFLGYYENDFHAVSAVRESMDHRLSEQFYEDGKIRDFSETNLYYLYQLIDLCKKEHIELVILNTPLHPYYKSKIPQKFIEKYDEIVREKNLKVIHFDHLRLKDSCFIPDGDHVSVEGAAITTRHL